MKRRQDFIFTSESVSEGHPDKICDIISDCVLDKALSMDSESRVACECFTSTGLILIGGEITTRGYIDLVHTAREVLRDIGYNDPADGIDAISCSVLSVIKPQSDDIASGIKPDKNKAQGAGDQGIMFGYACRQTEQLMPAPIEYAHRIMNKATEVRKSGNFDFLRPDAKCQVSVRYAAGKPVHIDTIIFSHQHKESVSTEELYYTSIEHIIKPSIPEGLIDKNTTFYINPTGRFVIGGPKGDAGLTGRKIIVDTYGGYSHHGGGAFSGKDPSKVDRSAAYMARYIAKNLVASGIADEINIQLSYGIGIDHAISIFVDSNDTAKVPDKIIELAIPDLFDTSPEGIIKTFDLKKPIYRPTASYGHFGRIEFPWEKTDMIEAIQRKLG